MDELNIDGLLDEIHASHGDSAEATANLVYDGLDKIIEGARQINDKGLAKIIKELRRLERKGVTEHKHFLEMQRRWLLERQTTRQLRRENAKLRTKLDISISQKAHLTNNTKQC